MLILKDKPGQLCNRLWAFSPFISDALENNYKVKILHFYDYYEYFENLESFNNLSFIKKSKSLSFYFYRIILVLIKLIPEFVLNAFGIYYRKNDNVAYLDIKKNIVIINSWDKKDTEKKLRIGDLQKLFQPKIKSVNKVNLIFQEKRKSSDLIIGVHIRRGDYKQYNNGKFFYSDSEYISFMSQLKKEFTEHQKITFLLCSNELVKLEAYKNISVFQIPEANLIEDLYGLSKCDYLIGSPSTYSMWASFYGQKPLLFLKNANLKLKLKDFGIIVSQNRFANGTVFSN